MGPVGNLGKISLRAQGAFPSNEPSPEKDTRTEIIPKYGFEIPNPNLNSA